MMLEWETEAVLWKLAHPDKGRFRSGREVAILQDLRGR